MRKNHTSYGLWKTALIYVNILSWNTKQGMGDWGQVPDTGRPNTTANYRSLSIWGQQQLSSFGLFMSTRFAVHLATTVQDSS